MHDALPPHLQPQPQPHRQQHPHQRRRHHQRRMRAQDLHNRSGYSILWSGAPLKLSISATTNTDRTNISSNHQSQHRICMQDDQRRGYSLERQVRYLSTRQIRVNTQSTKSWHKGDLWMRARCGLVNVQSDYVRLALCTKSE
jgi:hypothetical protein